MSCKTFLYAICILMLSIFATKQLYLVRQRFLSCVMNYSHRIPRKICAICSFTAAAAFTAAWAAAAAEALSLLQPALALCKICVQKY